MPTELIDIELPRFSKGQGKYPGIVGVAVGYQGPSRGQRK